MYKELNISLPQCTPGPDDVQLLIRNVDAESDGMNCDDKEDPHQNSNRGYGEKRNSKYLHIVTF